MLEQPDINAKYASYRQFGLHRYIKGKYVHAIKSL